MYEGCILSITFKRIYNFPSVSLPPYTNLLSISTHLDIIVNLWVNQARETFKVMSDMFLTEEAKCKARENASSQAIRTYYHQAQAANYNWDKAFHDLVTLTEWEPNHQDRTTKEIHFTVRSPKLSLYTRIFEILCLQKSGQLTFSIWEVSPHVKLSRSTLGGRAKS